ncbi:NAD(P)-dependent alcohol dehydrogenase [Aspergillus lucknowensis]|uniref:Enoyl reductase (ER) domain-containing protein n=1 Tax=Aspergillus lucknowensis TaxID=176173 RepID=A0ABR4LPS1_9EURO
MAGPAAMKAYLYNTTTPGGVVSNLTFNPSARAPPPPSSPSQILIKVLSTSLNPADYKVPEQSTIFGRVLICQTPASPGIDFTGRIVATHPAHKGEFSNGQLVFGCLARPRTFGTTAEYVLCDENDLAILPEGVSIDDAACIGIAIRTAWQSLKYCVKPSPSVGTGENQKVFINGGSGGCGVFAIQMAKMLGFHVTVTCSSRNEELVRGLGADEVIDYTVADVLETLKAKGQVFDYVLDHIGTPDNIYSECHQFLKESGAFVQVGAGSMMTVVWRTITPRFLGGGRRRFVPLMLKNSKEDLATAAQFLKDKKIKVVVDEVFEFGDVVKAYQKLCSGRARGKIIVHVAED